MDVKLHANATTTPKTRAYIQHSDLPVAVLARELGVNETTIRRWRGRDGLGLGDIKLAAVAGAWLGLVTIFAVIELATLSALAAYAVNAYWRTRPLRATAFLPFGAFLAPAIWIGWLAEALLTQGAY